MLKNVRLNLLFKITLLLSAFLLFMGQRVCAEEILGSEAGSYSIFLSSPITINLSNGTVEMVDFVVPEEAEYEFTIGGDCVESSELYYSVSAPGMVVDSTLIGSGSSITAYLKQKNEYTSVHL